MSCEGAAEGRTEDPRRQEGNGNSAVKVVSSGRTCSYGDRRVRVNPNMEHKPDRYDDVQSEYDPTVYCKLERHLPPCIIDASRDAKMQFMNEILSRYLPSGERTRAQKQKEYRHQIMAAYEPRHKELYCMHPSTVFLPEFIRAVDDKTEQSIRKIITEPFPGVYTFSMFQPNFCEMMLSEVDNFEKWAGAVKLKITRPNRLNKYGAVLDDFGLESMLDKLMQNFICPISAVFYPEVGGSSLDSHRGFVVEYGKDKDLDLGFHVDDSEVTLNICLGKKFSGGDLFFRGTRCDKHVNSEIQPEYYPDDVITCTLQEVFDYCHVPGQAVLHRGRHRHGARATTSGHRINLLLWCRSSIFRETKKCQKDFSRWCDECLREKKERQCQYVAATKLAFLKTPGETPA